MRKVTAPTILRSPPMKGTFLQSERHFNSALVARVTYIKWSSRTGKQRKEIIFVKERTGRRTKKKTMTNHHNRKKKTKQKTTSRQVGKNKNPLETPEVNLPLLKNRRQININKRQYRY